MIFALAIVGEASTADASTRVASEMWRLPSGAGAVAVTASSRAERATRASPPAQRASLSMRSGSTRGFARARPRSLSSRERLRILASSSGASGSRTTTRQRESSAEFTSNDGFSVVAPMSVIVPSSTAPRSASCSRLVEAMDLVDEQDGRARAALALAGLFDCGSDILHSGQHGGECDEFGVLMGGDQAREGGFTGAGRTPEDER